jgi:hypothetical protein
MHQGVVRFAEQQQICKSVLQLATDSVLESKKFKAFSATHHMPWFGNFDGHCGMIICLEWCDRACSKGWQ